MSGFETTTQALMSHTVAVAITRLLIQNAGDFPGNFIGARLKRELIVASPELFLA
jgi:hypothetical protein